MIAIPQDVQNWLRNVFQKCNHQASRKIDRNPFAYEEHLDISLIEILQQESAPVKFASDWTVQINTHFLGKVPMYGNFEVADIGLLVIFRSGQKFVRSKVALLQSKRLYPESVEAESEAETFQRYHHGFGALFLDDIDFTSLAEERTITFDKTSRYKKKYKEIATSDW